MKKSIRVFVFLCVIVMLPAWFQLFNPGFCSDQGVRLISLASANGFSDTTTSGFILTDKSGVYNIWTATYTGASIIPVTQITSLESPYAVSYFNVDEINEQIVYSYYENGKRTQYLRVIDYSGNLIREITNLPSGGGAYSYFDISPDGSRIVFAKGLENQGLNLQEGWIVGMDNTGLNQIIDSHSVRNQATHKTSFKWLDLDTIVFSNTEVWSDAAGRHEIHILDLSTGAYSAWAGNSPSTSRGDGYLVWSPDHSKVAVRTMALRTPSGIDILQWPSGQHRSELIPMNQSAAAPKYWISNTRLIYSQDGDLFSINVDGSDIRNLTNTASEKEVDVFLIRQAVPTMQTAVILTKTSPNHTITSGSDVQVYGTAVSNQLTLESGAKAELINFPGFNVIKVQSHSGGLTVSRSGQMVTFQGTDGTVLKIPATTDVQTISFAGQAPMTLNVYDNQVMLDDQVITTFAEPIAKGNVVISSNLVAANPSPVAQNVYNFLKENYGSKIISGTVATVDWNTNEADWVHHHTGKYPAMNTFDYIHLNAPWSNYSDTKVVEDWWANNGIVSACWHWNVPPYEGATVYDLFSANASETTFRAANATVEGTWENDIIEADLEKIAVYLKLLQEKNIPVIWRPLHEAAGNIYRIPFLGKAWFWWGNDGADAFKKLWIYMFECFEEKGLNNLIWVWTTQTKDDAFYPGDEYVDIIGRDIYDKGNEKYFADQFEEIQAAYPNKMVALSETGKEGYDGNLALISEQWNSGALWSYFMPWYDFNRTKNTDSTAFEETTHEQADITWWEDAFAHERVITRDKMPDLKRICSSGEGNQGEYFYAWNRDGDGTACMDLGPDGNYGAKWDSIGNFVGGKGWNPGSSNRIIGYNAGDWSPNGNAYLALYGWTKEPCVEYYVVESWHDDFMPPGPGINPLGSVTSDGGTYNIYEIDVKNSPSVCSGNLSDYKQYWSVRTQKIETGINATINFKNHVDAWNSLGLPFGEHYYQIMATEGYESSGQSNITVWDEKIKNNNEIDIEFLTSIDGVDKTNSVYFVTHTPTGHYQPTNGPSPLEPYGSIGEKHWYGFDWHPDRIDFLINDQIVRTIYGAEKVPQDPGRLIINTWSGNEQWGGNYPENSIIYNRVDQVTYEPAFFEDPSETPSFFEETFDQSLEHNWNISDYKNTDGNNGNTTFTPGNVTLFDDYVTLRLNNDQGAELVSQREDFHFGRYRFQMTVAFTSHLLNRGEGMVFGAFIYQKQNGEDTPPLTVSITAPSTSHVNESVSFQADVSGGSGSYDYEWDFGDEDYDFTATPSHTYYSEGEYNVTLTVTDDENNSASDTVKISVYTVPNGNGYVKFRGTVITGETKHLVVCYGSYFSEVEIDTILEGEPLIQELSSVEVCYGNTALDIYTGCEVEVYGYYYGISGPFQMVGRIDVGNDGYVNILEGCDGEDGVLDAQNITISLDGVTVNQCGSTWTESGVVLSFVETTAEDCGEGSCSFGIDPGSVWLWPCRLNLDLSGLGGTVAQVEVDIVDYCGVNCTRAFLYNGSSTLDNTGNTQVSTAETLFLSSGGTEPDRLALSSCEGEIKEIRLTIVQSAPL